MSKPSKPLLDKLRPKAKAPGIGKVAPCDRCGHPDAEHYSANYIQCPRCDVPAEGPTAKVVKWFVGPDGNDDFFDEDTSPGWPAAQVAWSPATDWYRCSSCYTQTKTQIDKVANGGTCACGGTLWRKP